MRDRKGKSTQECWHDDDMVNKSFSNYIRWLDHKLPFVIEFLCWLQSIDFASIIQFVISSTLSSLSIRYCQTQLWAIERLSINFFNDCKTELIEDRWMWFKCFKRNKRFLVSTWEVFVSHIWRTDADRVLISIR